MKLSPNFTLEEMTYSQTAARTGLDNTPPADVVENLKRLAAFLERVRSLLGGRAIFISSGYRSAKVNKAVGGKGTSQHQSGLAADIKVAGMTPKQVVDVISKSRLDFDQVILEFDAWTHISVAPVGKEPRGEALIIDKSGVRFYA
jgi:hypothetical protein